MTSTQNPVKVHRFELWVCDIPEESSYHKMCGLRPVLIISNGYANRTSPTCSAVPITSNTTRRKLATHVSLNGFGLAKPSVAHIENVSCIPKEWLVKAIGKVDDINKQKELLAALELHFSDAGEGEF